MVSLGTIRARVVTFLQSDPGKRVIRVGRVLLVGGVIALLGFQLTRIGWGRVLASLPSTPWFYVIFLMMYFLLPVYEGLIYRKLWGIPFRESISVLVRKRVLNNDVVGYSGEVYLYWWGRKRTGLSDRAVFNTIKDNSITSSLASTTALILLVGTFLLTDQVVLVDVLNVQDPAYVIFGLIAAGVLAGIGFRFRRTIFGLPKNTILGLAGVHLSRFVVMYTLQVLQWWVVLPEAPLKVWATILVVGTLTSRIPFLPARDLVSIGAILGISGLLNTAEAVIAGMLIVRSGLDKLFNISLFTLTSWLDRRRGSSFESPVGTPIQAPEPLAEADAASTS